MGYRWSSDGHEGHGLVIRAGILEAKPIDGVGPWLRLMRP